MNNLDDAINLISSSIKLNLKKTILPYFFIVGAGISRSEIPSSKEIIKLCKLEVGKRDKLYYEQCLKDTEEYINNPMQYYSKWLKLAYPIPK